MPELPEVETTARLVRPKVEGRAIHGVHVSWPRSIGERSLASFRRRVVGTHIAGVRRRAKYIVFDLEREHEAAGALLLHLRMSGRLLVEGRGSKPSPYVRVALELEGDRVLRFLDVRKFGRLLFVADPEEKLAVLGPEPLDGAFTPEWLHDALRARARMLKPLLLDQNFLAGLGNIYVDEALHRARLHPLRRSDSVPRRSATRLHGAIQAVLRSAIEKQGASFDGFYRTPEGQPGAYQHEFRVYGRGGRPCPRCAAPVRKLVVGQRGTHVCLRCQRKPREKAARRPSTRGR